MIGGVENVGVIQLPVGGQVREDALNGGVDALERLKTLRHEQIGESVVHRLHLVHLQISNAT